MNFKWKEHRVNNIDSNPIESWYTIANLGMTLRLYKIVPQYPSDEQGCINENADPECYIFYENLFDRKLTDEEKVDWQFNYAHYDGYLFKTSEALRVFKTLDEAKARASLQYETMDGIFKTYFPKDNDK